MLLVAIHQLVKKSQEYSKSYSKCGQFTLTTIMNNNIQTIFGLTLILWNSRSIYANIQENLANDIINGSQESISNIINSEQEITKTYSTLKSHFRNPKFNKSLWTNELTWQYS